MEHATDPRGAEPPPVASACCGGVLSTRWLGGGPAGGAGTPAGLVSHVCAEGPALQDCVGALVFHGTEALFCTVASMTASWAALAALVISCLRSSAATMAGVAHTVGDPICGVTFV